MMCFFQHFICNVWILCHIMFFLLFVMFGCYIIIKKKKKTQKWERGVNCDEEMREKNEMGERDLCMWWGRRKRKARGYIGGEKKEKRNGEWDLCVQWEKMGSGKERRKKNLKGKKLNWFYLYVHFVWCKMQNFENLFRGCL